MIEYSLMDKNNKPVTLDELREVDKAVGALFQEKETHDMSRTVRKTYGVNGQSFHIYYNEKASKIFLPKKYEEPIKNMLMDKGGLICL